MNIIELAKQAGFWQEHINTWMCTTQDIERFVVTIRNAALEEAAMKCEQYAKHKLEEEMPIAYVYGARECAESIRWMKVQK